MSLVRLLRSAVTNVESLFFFLVLRISLTLRVGQGADLLVHLASDVMRMSMASKFNFLCRASTIDKILGTGGSDLCLLGNQIV